MKPIDCHRCDFASGRRGMDRCSLCDGTGSLFRVGRQFFANTEEGHAAAEKAAQEKIMTDEQIKYVADRFLTWTLPTDFNPDGGITAKRPAYAPGVEWAPTGTNLLNHQQAEAMVRYILAGLPKAD